LVAQDQFQSDKRGKPAEECGARVSPAMAQARMSLTVPLRFSVR